MVLFRNMRTVSFLSKTLVRTMMNLTFSTCLDMSYTENYLKMSFLQVFITIILKQNVLLSLYHLGNISEQLRLNIKSQQK
jgi:hypothetical protein